MTISLDYTDGALRSVSQHIGHQPEARIEAMGVSGDDPFVVAYVGALLAYLSPTQARRLACDLLAAAQRVAPETQAVDVEPLMVAHA